MSETRRYRKKPVVIEAVQVRWSNWSALCDFLGGIIGPHNPGRITDECNDPCGESAPYIELTIPTLLEINPLARHGDWIIKDVKGKFYPCRPDIFAATYKAVTDE